MFFIVEEKYFHIEWNFELKRIINAKCSDQQQMELSLR